VSDEIPSGVLGDKETDFEGPGSPPIGNQLENLML
jgi:hypothetical protein